VRRGEEERRNKRRTPKKLKFWKVLIKFIWGRVLSAEDQRDSLAGEKKPGTEY